MNPSNEQPLTPEKYQEIKSQLESENLEKFPSLFQQARNLAKQAWTSGIDVAKGKPLMASAEKAAERMAICESCEFFKMGRCAKCGCFMTAKVHLESSGCPINKWGPELQKVYSQDTVQKNMQQNRPNGEPPEKSEMEVDLIKFPKQVADEMIAEAEEALNYDGRFSYKGSHYSVTADDKGVKKIYQMIKKLRKKPSLPETKNPEQQKELLVLIEKHLKTGESKMFSFDGENYYIDKDPSTGKNVVFKVDQVQLQNAMKMVKIPNI